MDYHYVFLSPVFDSISNSGYNSKFKINELKLFLNNKEDRPAVIALSGINEGRLSKIHDIGFDGFALLGYIWTEFEDNQDIIASVLRYRKIVKEVNRLTSSALSELSLENSLSHPLSGKLIKSNHLLNLRQ